MPRQKGWKKPVPPKPTQCATCGKMLPGVALRGVMGQLRTLTVDLAKRPEEGAGLDESRRHARFRVLHAQGAIELLLEDEALFCFGHDEPKAKPGPKPKPKPDVDPSFPADPETPKVRKRPGRKPGGAALAIVTESGS